MTVTEAPTLEVFSLKSQLLSSGRSDRLMSETDDLWLYMKVYASGGENNLHRHPTEDHAFVVLAGQATFFDRDENPTVVNAYEGAMLPKGAFYHFCSSAEEPLVMLRIGAGVNPYRNAAQRFSLDGTVDMGQNDPAGQVPIVPIPGKFFPE
jgi:mannose-6-phosphate isomerase-like protein (cupin superfamily)